VHSVVLYRASVSVKAQARKKIGDVKMQVSPISSYRINSQTFEANEKPYMPQVAFTGSERPPHGSASWGKRVVAGIMLSLVTLFGGSAMAQTATNTTQTTAVAENKATAKPIVFAQEAFYIDEGSKQLKVAAVNTKGDTSGFNFILGNLLDYSDEKSTKWWVAGVTTPAEGSRLNPWVCFAKLGDSEAKPLLIDDVNVVAYVTKLLNDARNLTGAEVKQAVKTTVTAMK
jgi:hypothetical protein